MPDRDDLPDTGRVALQQRAASGDPVAKALDQILADREREEGAERERERNANRWRALGGLAAGAALSLAGYALTLAQTASQDHLEVMRGREERARLVETVARVEREGRDRSEQIDRRLTAIESDVRWVRDGMARLLDERRDGPRRGGR